MFFSVIIPLFNKQCFIADTIASVSAQDFTDFEIIVVDDGSTDKSLDEARAIPDRRLRLIQQENAGPGVARNRGAAAAQGDWLAFINADDVWAINHLSVLKELITDAPPANVVATTSRQFRNEEMEPTQRAMDEDRRCQIDYLADAGERFVHTSSIAIRREVFLDTGGFGAFCPGEDTELWVRLALEHPFVISTATTSGYRRATDGIMEQLEQLNEPPAGPGEAPVQVTLERALKDPKYALRHSAIRAYLDRARQRIAKIALVRGYPDVARKHLRALTSKGKMAATAYMALTWIPGPIFKVLVRSVSARRKVYRRLTASVPHR